MKVTHASWERRNLGLDAYEIALDNDDLVDFQDVSGELASPRYRGCYVVVKLPVGSIMAVHRLEDAGFRFVEAQLKITCDLAHYACPPSLRRLEGYMTCESVDSSDRVWQDVVERIPDDMFVTDRIYLDPAFPPGTSAKRYRNWISDMRADGRKTMLVARLARTGELAAFDVMSSLAPEAVACIGGVFSARAMLGFPHMLALFRHLKANGALRFLTSISSNNLPMMKVYAQLGGIACDGQYVMRRIGAREDFA